MKRFFSILLISALLLSVSLSAMAQDLSSYVFDDAGLLTQPEEESLRFLAAQLHEAYGLNIAIVTTNTLHGKSPQQYADDDYDRRYGQGSDGILFLLSMEDRDWYISTSGKAMDLFTDGEVYDSADEIIHYLSDGDYYDGFSAWLQGLSYYLDTTEPEPQPNLILAVIIGAVVALIVVLIMRAGMNTKRQQYSAGQYMVPGSYHLRTHQDFFLYSRTTKTARPKENSSGGGGRSHGGGGGKF